MLPDELPKFEPGTTRLLPVASMMTSPSRRALVRLAAEIVQTSLLLQMLKSDGSSSQVPAWPNGAEVSTVPVMASCSPEVSTEPELARDLPRQALERLELPRSQRPRKAVSHRERADRPRRRRPDHCRQHRLPPARCNPA